MYIRPFKQEDDSDCRMVVSQAAMSSFGPWLESREVIADPTTPLEAAERQYVAVNEAQEIIGYVASNLNHIEGLYVVPRFKGLESGECCWKESNRHVLVKSR